MVYSIINWLFLIRFSLIGRFKTLSKITYAGAKFAGDLGNSTGAKDQQYDDQNNEKFRNAYVH
ncbi:hypothetical protein ANAEL_02926 [Anaerolineales bacterium]|nr:hypothetical protein ANAEL_02926 [Anaerolineales bacterium]